MFESIFGSKDGQPMGPSHALVTILPVSDMAAAQRFFERLGFRVDYGEEEYVMMNDGQGGQVHLRKSGPSFIKPANPVGLYLYTQDVDRLAALFGNEILEPSKRPEEKEWGTYEFTVTGPDGIEVQVGWPLEQQG
jgi:catechol 2,3-dioxygenase-like lactoylglutathione lyase family enzyme